MPGGIHIWSRFQMESTSELWTWAQAKNGDQQTVLEIEISCSQWEGSACTQSTLILFYFKFWVRGKGRIFFFFFIFPLFPSSSQWVPNVFPKGVPNMCCPKPRWAKWGKALQLSIESSIFGASTCFCNGPIKLAHCQKKKKKKKKKGWWGGGSGKLAYFQNVGSSLGHCTLCFG